MTRRYRQRKYLSATDAELIWAEWRKGQTSVNIGAMLAQPDATVRLFLARHGGMMPRPRRRASRVLSLAEREEISRGLARAESLRALARRLGHAPSSVSREIRRHGGTSDYRALAADAAAWARATRPKRCRLAMYPRLRAVVAAKLRADWSPQQIAAWLVTTYPNDSTMHVSHETIYRTLYVQARGALKKELTRHLRRRRTMRRSRAATTRGHGKGELREIVSISERPPSVADRAVPGHWEGDLLLGARHSQIATLVERQSRFVMLVRIPARDSGTVTRRLARHIQRLPARLRTSLTWDRGKEMADHKQLTLATEVQVYFCDPRSPWQRGSNELLRQYFPKGTDLANLTQRQLDAVALKLNTRPRETLNWNTPAEMFSTAVASTD